METATTQQAKTRRRLRTRGTTRRRSNALGGAVTLNTDAVSAVLIPIYNELPKTIAAGQHNLTYGEVEWQALKVISEYTKKQQWPSSNSGRFYDLGCGRGRAVLYMALAGPFDQSVGIEVLPERVSLAQQALAKLKTSIPSAGAKVRLYEASFLNPSFKYKDARVVFLSNLCFDNETQDALFKKLNLEMPKGSLLFCSREPAVPLEAFEKVGMEKVPMTWTPTSEIHILRHL
jgi:SAM-dependent methyltransferase